MLGEASREGVAALRIFSRRSFTPEHEAGLFPFGVPRGAGLRGATDLSAWNRPIHGEADRLYAGAEGCLYRGGERVRLFGFNLAEGAALPDRGIGRRLAARLAGYGANYVRIAQHSNPAPAGWLDPDAVSTVSAEALERLDHFAAELRRRGIYLHLVLNHFRAAYPPTIPGYDTKQRLPAGWPRRATGVTHFFTPLIRENHAVARSLLTHRNRRTGLTYAEDPAIAVVEVTNEDGLVQSWYEGGLDRIITAPGLHLGPLRDELQVRWNRWLRATYHDDAALRKEWAPGAASRSPTLVINGHVTRAGGAAHPSGRLIVAQHPVPLIEGRAYRITLWARAARPNTGLSLRLRSAQPPHATLLARNIDWTLSEEWKQYTGRVTATATDTHAEMALLVAAEDGGTQIADVALREDASVGLLDGESAAHSTVPPLSRAGFGLRMAQAQRDWIAFLFDIESRFFADQIRFLREELHVRSLLVGTQGDCSPTVGQAGSDLTSVHGYWAHPEFPGRDWDAVDWFVPNRSIVDAREEWHALNRIAYYRRSGKPLLVDEYNHPQPNTFGAEGFPLAAAYGAFQDWDGIAGWVYREGSWTHWLSRKDFARPMIRSHFEMDSDPVRLLSAWLGAVIFRRGDVAPGRHLVRIGVGTQAEQEIAGRVGLIRRHEVIGNRDGAALLPLRHRVGLQDGAPPATPPGPPAAGEPVVSDTGELAWDRGAAGGTVIISTPRTKAVIGTGAGQEFVLGAVIIRPGATAQNGFGVWAVTALDGMQPIESARRLIIVALGYSQNTDPDWRIYPDLRLGAGPPPPGSDVTVGAAWGRPPVVVEGLAARIVLPLQKTPRVWALDAMGRRRNRIAVRVEDGRAIVEIGPRHRTLWYEAVLSRGGH